MYAFIAAIFIILICLLFLPLKVIVSFIGKKLTVKAFLAGIPVFKFDPSDKVQKEKSPEKAPGEKVDKFKKDTLSFGEKIKHYAEIFRTSVKLLRKYVLIDKVNLKIDVGTGDAATTAVSTGVLWGSVYSLLGIIGSIMFINKHDVQINPVYTQTAFSMEGKCIIKSRIVYIIFIAITILMKIKSRKGKEE